mgnify:CR=1 FL=1|tara:strand:- start:2699 stop:3814 length:1116 start_codon:yes stop_codon:yes gene_type:complete
MNWLTKILTWLGLRYQPYEPEKKPRKPSARREKKHYGAHYYLSDLLDNIDEAFTSMNGLKKADKHLYKIFSKIACHVSDKNLVVRNTDDNHWKIDVNDIPALGSAYMGTAQKNREIEEDNEDKLYPTMVFFRRIKRPFNVQPTNNITLECGFVFNSERDQLSMTDIFHVEVYEDGSVQPLKTLMQEPVRLKTNKHDKRGPYFVRTRWKYPEMLEQHCIEAKISMSEYVSFVLWGAVNMCVASDQGVQVRVSKGNRRITFAVDMLRTPYFFNDRDKVVNENGQTKRIFHIVRAHERTMAGGEKKIIRSHTKGLRKFKWNGYSVNILLPGKHINSINEWTTDGIPYVDIESAPEGLVCQTELSKKLSKILDHA